MRSAREATPEQKAAARDQIIRDLEALLPQNGSAADAPENLYATVHDARAIVATASECGPC